MYIYGYEFSISKSEMSTYRKSTYRRIVHNEQFVLFMISNCEKGGQAGGSRGGHGGYDRGNQRQEHFFK